MKILFYDIDDFSRSYMLDRISSNIEPYFFKIPLNKNTYIDEKYADSEAISVFTNSYLREDELSKFENLKFIFLRTTGYSNIDLNYCKKHNIKLFNVPDYGSYSIAEYGFLLLLSAARKLKPTLDMIKEGTIDHLDIAGVELFSKTLGIIGLGTIGKKIATIAKGFGLKVIAYDIKEDGYYDYVSLDNLLEESDFIMISCPLTPQTKGMIGRGELSKMKKSAILVNIARGEIVDTISLTEALVKKRISGAALDVIECEHTLCALWDFCQNTEAHKNCLKKFLYIEQLKKMENIIITPHNAYNTIEARKKILDITMENIQNSFEINADTKNIVML